MLNRNTKFRLGEGRRRASYLDLLFCSKNAHHLFDYSQVKDTWGSDHFPIIFDTKIKRNI